MILAWGGAVAFCLPEIPLFLAYGRDDLWVPRWVPTLGMPCGSLVLGAFPWRRRWLALLLLLGVQVGVVIPALVLDARTPRSIEPKDVSRREYQWKHAVREGWPNPRDPWVLDLGGGVRMLMTTTCHVDAQGNTLPKAMTTPPAFPPSIESVHAPTTRALENMAAFTQALGCIRFFHPSDEAAGADWAWLAAQGILYVEDSSDAAELSRRLTAWFSPWAPTVGFLPAGSPGSMPPVPHGARGLVRWLHRGPGCGSDAANPAPKVGTGDSLLQPQFLELPGRGTRLAGVALAWTTFQHFHPWLDRRDWFRRLPGALTEAAQAADGTAYLTALQRLTAWVPDGHIFVVRSDRDDFALPPLALALVDGQALVARCWGQAKGIPPGSMILAVDGEPVPLRILRMRELISASTEGWALSRLACGLLAGESGTPVVVDYRTPDGAMRQARLHRTESVREITRPGESSLVQLLPGIWHVVLSQCTELDGPLLMRVIQEAEGIIFDLRDYPENQGLCLAVLAHLAHRPLWSPRWMEPVFTRPNLEGLAWDGSRRWNIAHRRPRARGRVVFLAGGGTISAAETLLGMVEHYRLGILAGEPTAGCNGNRNVTTLPGGLEVSWTGMKVQKHDGSPHEGVGFQPEILIRPTAQGLAQGQDEVLERALALVQAPPPQP